MKKLLFTSLVLLTTFGCSPATANNLDCISLSSLAETAMQNRQDGIKLTDQLDLINKGEDRTGTTEVIEAVVVGAYDTPQFDLEENKQRASQEYSNQVYLTCYKVQNK